jgi:hypothetical protein
MAGPWMCERIVACEFRNFRLMPCKACGVANWRHPLLMVCAFAEPLASCCYVSERLASGTYMYALKRHAVQREGKVCTACLPLHGPGEWLACPFRTGNVALYIYIYINTPRGNSYEGGSCIFHTTYPFILKKYTCQEYLILKTARGKQSVQCPCTHA